MASPVPSVLSNVSPPQWGLFNADGSPALVASSFATLDYSHDYRISNYQQEEGAFASYNKVQQPYSAKIGFLVGGDAGTRAAFLNQAEQVCASLDLVTIITPEIPYMNANPIRPSYRRTSRNGVTLILVEIELEEVRIISSVSQSNTASVNGASPQQNGVTQPGGTLTDGTAQTQGSTTFAGNFSGVGPQTTITTSEAQTNQNYQYFNLGVPLTSNLSLGRQ